jgi:hypothetical protein
LFYVLQLWFENGLELKDLYFLDFFEDAQSEKNIFHKLTERQQGR